MQTDMTVGKPMKMLLNFTIPVFLGNVFQQLYSMADAVIVGKFVGTKGLAAVGATGTITFLIIGLRFLLLRSSEPAEWMRCVRRLVMQQFFLL